MPVLDSERQQSDVAVDNSNKLFTVPAGAQWRIQSVWAQLASTAAAGNRYVVVQWDDGTNILGQVACGALQAASLTRRYTFANGLPDLPSFRDIGGSVQVLLTPLPNQLVLPAGYRLRVYDVFAIDAAADDLLVRVLVDAE